jgi:hypothetical protein
MASDITYTTDCNFSATVTITGPTIIGSPNCPGTIYQYKYIVTDACGRKASATRNFIIGNNGPTITCPPFNLILACGNPNNQSYINQHFGLVTVNTSCGVGYTLTYTPQINLSCGTSTVYTFKATDACGRTSTCTTTVAIQGNSSQPIVIPPPNVDEFIDCDEDVDYWYNHWIESMEAGLVAKNACEGDVRFKAISTPLNTNCVDGSAQTVVTFASPNVCGKTTTVTGTFTILNNQPLGSTNCNLNNPCFAGSKSADNEGNKLASNSGDGLIFIQPNPVFYEDVTVFITVMEAQQYAIRVSSISGHVIVEDRLDLEAGQHSYLIPNNIISNGMYFVQIQNQYGELFIRKFVKTKE